MNPIVVLLVIIIIRLILIIIVLEETAILSSEMFPRRRAIWKRFCYVSPVRCLLKL